MFTGQVSLFWAILCSSSLFSIVSELSGQLDKVVVGDFPVPGGRELLDQLVFDCRMSVDYLQGYFTPETLNRIHILRLGGQDQRPDAVLALPLDYQFGTMTLFPLSSFKQNEYWNDAIR